MLEVRNLNAGYGKQQVLFEVSLRVKPSEIVALIGPNGAGKSTVIRSIFSLVDIYSGSIKLNGQDITRLPTHKLIELGVSYAPQGRHLFPNMTVRENLEMGAFLTKDEDIVNKRIGVILQHFPELKPKLNSIARSLSGGQQQMVSLSRALMQDPKVLLLDEPSAGLAPNIVTRIFNEVVKLNKEGVSVLIVEQNAKEAVRIAHSIYVLEDGKVALHGGKRILKNKMIKSIYLGGR